MFQGVTFLRFYLTEHTVAETERKQASNPGGILRRFRDLLRARVGPRLDPEQLPRESDRTYHEEQNRWDDTYATHASKWHGYLEFALKTISTYLFCKHDFPPFEYITPYQGLRSSQLFITEKMEYAIKQKRSKQTKRKELLFNESYLLQMKFGYTQIDDVVDAAATQSGAIE